MAGLTYAFALACGLFALTACAEGGSIDGEGGGGSGEGGANGSTSAASTTGPNSSSASTGAGDEGGAGAGGTPAVGGGGAGEGGNPQQCDYTASEDCAGAEPLPAIAGDDGSPIVTVTGDTSKWVKIHIEEQVSGISGENLSYTVSLTSPAGMNYDLKVRQGAQEGNPECDAAVQNGTGTPESVSDSWDDDQGFGGEDDSVWLVIEVVYVSGDDCGTGSLWTLQIRGNT